MKKIFFIIFSLCMLFLSSCAKNSIEENNDDVIQEITMPKPFSEKEGAGGDSAHNFYSDYAFRFGNIESTISNLVDREKSNEWIDNCFAEANCESRSSGKNAFGLYQIF